MKSKQFNSYKTTRLRTKQSKLYHFSEKGLHVKLYGKKLWHACLVWERIETAWRHQRLLASPRLISWILFHWNWPAFCQDLLINYVKLFATFSHCGKLFCKLSIDNETGKCPFPHISDNFGRRTGFLSNMHKSTRLKRKTGLILAEPPLWTSPKLIFFAAPIEKRAGSNLCKHLL